jgi:hypothetical protein
MDGMGKLGGRPLATLDNHTLTIVGPPIGAKQLAKLWLPL